MKDKYKLEVVNLLTKEKITRVFKGTLKEVDLFGNVLHIRPSFDKIIVHYWKNERAVY